MFEFSYEANASLSVLQENLKVLADTTVNTAAARIAIDHDPVAFLHRVGKAALHATRALELFVAAVAESSLQTGVFPTVIPRRPQPAAGSGLTVALGVAMQQGLTKNASTVQGALMKKMKSMSAARSASPLTGSQTARKPSVAVTEAPTSTLLPTPGTGFSFVPKPPIPAPTPALATAVATTTASSAVRYASSTDSVEGIVSIGAYMLLESLVRETMAREAVWYSYQDGADEAKAVALYAAKPKAPAAAGFPDPTAAARWPRRWERAMRPKPEAVRERNCR